MTESFASQAALAESNRSSRIKVAVAFNIVKFVSWPKTDRVRTSLRACTLVGSALNSTVLDTFDGKSVGGLPLNVLEISNLQDIPRNRCDIVLLEDNQKTPLLDSVRNEPVLSICQADTVRWEGCIAQVITMNNKARIAFDLFAARESGLNVSSELLELSIVRKVE